MTQAKLSKTHRWSPELFARVEELARRTGRRVQHVLDDTVAIGLEQMTDSVDTWGTDMDKWQVWESYVGSQTCEEFWTVSQQEGATSYREAAERYAKDLPNTFRDDWLQMEANEFPDLDRIASALEDCLVEQLDEQNS
jgi:hypothetical protein